MTSHRLSGKLQELEDLKADNRRHIDRAASLVERQRHVVLMLRKDGRDAGLAESLLAQLERSLELARWRQAWIESSLLEYSHFGLEGQPYPWRVEPPPNVLDLICAELGQIVAQGQVDSQRATDEAVKAALRSVAGGR